MVCFHPPVMTQVHRTAFRFLEWRRGRASTAVR